MKKILLFIPGLFSFAIQAQTLTQAANEPATGDKESLYYIDTSAYNNGLPNTISGNNANWNFSNLSAQPPSDTNFYVSPSSVPESSLFPTATVVQKSGPLNTFIRSVTSPTTQTEILGIRSGSLSLTFTNTAIAAVYPISFGSTVNDNIGGSYNYNSQLSGNFAGSISTKADGQGNLVLPNGFSFSNVLRVKSVQNITLFQGSFPVATAVQTIYNYYHSPDKFPVLSVNYTSISLIISPGSPTVTGFVTGNVNAFVTGIPENQAGETFVNLYPNPVENDLHLKLSNDVTGSLQLEFYDICGRLVKNETIDPAMGNSQQLSVNHLAKGLYMVKVKNGSDQRIHRMVIN